MKSSSDILISDWSQARPDIDERYRVLLRFRAIAMLMDDRSEHVARSLSLKRRELYVLFALRRSGGAFRMRPTDIFKVLQVTSGTLTYRIDRMEALGLVQRVPDPEDRRSHVVELTDKGRELADKAVELEIEGIATPIQDFLQDETSVGLLNDILKRLGNLYDAAISESDNPLIHKKVSSNGSS
jgi:DNA-binding MarR family transcriptional regulator